MNLRPTILLSISPSILTPNETGDVASGYFPFVGNLMWGASPFLGGIYYLWNITFDIEYETLVTSSTSGTSISCFDCLHATDDGAPTFGKVIIFYDGFFYSLCNCFLVVVAQL
jgi:hypothetical protein